MGGLRVFISLAFLTLLFVSAADAQRGYVSLRGSGSIGSFSTSGNAIDKTLAGFSDPTYNTVTPDGSKVFVDDVDANKLRIVNTLSNTLTTKDIGGGMFGLAVNPQGNRLFACVYGDDVVAVIDTATNVKLTTFAVSRPAGIAVSPDGTKLYVSSDTNGDVIILSAATGQQLGSIQLSKARNILVSPDGSKLFVSDQSDRRINVISTTTNSVIGSIAGNDDTRQMAITPNGQKLYAANLETNKVTVIDTVTHTKITSIAGFQTASGVAISSDGETLYAASSTADVIYLIDTKTDQIVNGLPALSHPAQMSLTPGQAPTAAFSSSAAAQAQSAIEFDGSASSTPQGTTIARYNWNFGDGTTLSSHTPTVSHTYASPGNYMVTLTVTNSEGVSTERVFNGVALLRNGNALAEVTKTLDVGPAPATPEAPGATEQSTSVSPTSAPETANTASGPTLTLLKAKALKIKGAKSLTVKVKSSRVLAIIAAATITNASGMELQRIKPKGATVSIKPNRVKRLRFPLSKRALKALKKQLHTGRKLYVNLAVTGRVGSDSVMEKTRIRLVLP